ncbi:MAG: carbohydrate-binding family 9-like protein [Pleomorphochaeta sp.]
MKIYNQNNKREIKELKLEQRWSKEDGVLVNLKLSHDDKHLIATFDIFENEIRKDATSHNDKVYEDSCVECFLQNINSKNYINFEFSVSSFILAGYGKDRYERKLFDPNLIETIFKDVKIYSEEINNAHWGIVIYIDLYKWGLVDEKKLTNQKIKANFNECGHKLKSTHYFSLFEIDSEVPNFHISDSFKELFFV